MTENLVEHGKNWLGVRATNAQPVPVMGQSGIQCYKYF